MSCSYGDPQSDLDLAEDQLRRIGERMRIDEYEGKNDAQSVLTYLDAVTAQCAVMGTTGSDTWLRVFEAHLKGTARRWFTQYKEEHAGLGELSKAQTTIDFKIRYLPSGYQESALEDMLRLKQKGDIQKYCELFEQLRELVDVPYQDEQVLKGFFLRGLAPEVATAVRLNNPVDMAECYRHAHWAYSQTRAGRQTRDNKPYYRGFRRQAPMIPTFRPADNTDDEDKMDLDAMAIKPNRHNRRRKNNVCYLCGESGHFKRDCPHKRRNKTEN